MTIYAIKGSDDQERIVKVYNSLKTGEGRFGWSNIQTADLRVLRERVEQDGWESLSQQEKNCYHGFLLAIEPEDYVVYINVPKWGECTLAKVTGPYEWRFDDEDFNHRFPVSAESVRVFNRNDKTKVHPALSARLKLQGRWWTISTQEEFNQLLRALDEGTPSGSSTPETNLKHLLPEITKAIHHTHPNKDLEDFVEGIFKKVPGVISVRPRRGRADHGADLLVDFESGLVPGLVRQDTLAIQVKSWGGEHNDSSAIDDIKRAFEYYEKDEDENVTMGLIVSTAVEAGDKLISELDKLQEDSGKPVALLLGAELAKFVLKYAGDILN